MVKKYVHIVLILLLVFTQIPTASAYYTISKNDPQDVMSNPIYNSANDEIRINYKPSTVKRHIISYFFDESFSQPGTSKNVTASTFYTGVGLTCIGYYELTIFNASGIQIGKTRVAVEEGDLQNPKCASGGDDELPSNGDDCDSCEVFDCPGWGQYMGKIDDIIAAIPPPPNWNQIIGTAPTPQPIVTPPTPTPPMPPAIPYEQAPDLSIPQGQLPDGFEDSSFSFGDIKDEAPVIEFREDPTGGFNIVDPIGSLPSQDEFIQNAHDEGIAPLPAAPNEGDNYAPFPKDTTDTAPMPYEEFDSPPFPSDPTNIAPTPSDNIGAPPIPNDGATAPIPNEDLIAPLPSGDNSTAPIPGDSPWWSAPIP